MVDLVKIRKKAKEKADSEVAGREAEVAGRRSRVAEEKPANGLGVAPVSSSAPRKVAGRGSQAAGEKPADASLRGAPTKAGAASDRKPESKTSPKSAGGDSGAAQGAEVPALLSSQPTTDNRQPSTDAPTAEPTPLMTKLKRFLESAGERRVERAQEARGAAEAQLELLTFSIAGELYAVSIDNVVEIVTPRAVTRIPNSDPSVVGILSLRGMIVTVIDARRRLGHPGTETPTPETRIIVVQLDHEILGFSVDKVQRVVKVEATAVAPHPVVHASEQDDSVRGVFRHGDALTILLDLDKLLNTRAVVAPAS